VKVFSWNCNMAFREKARKALALKPDLLVIPECECPDKLELDSDVKQPSQMVWVGDNPNKGLGVFSYSDFKLDLHDTYDPCIKYVAPIVVSGKVHFNLLAVWATNNKKDHDRRYIAQVWLAVKKYETLLSEPALIVGDFNWNKIWDDSRNLRGNLTQTVEFLSKKGIVSLYHSFFEEPFGQETHPTLYMYRKLNRPYHVDYIFASMSFQNRLRSVRVGEYERWRSASDHMPLVTTFDSVAAYPHWHDSRSLTTM
jgi:exodeoxyribonuclease-3